MKFNVTYKEHKLPAVVKVIAGNRYIILKFRDLQTGGSMINRAIKNYQRHKRIREDDLLYHFVKYVHRMKITEADIEIIKETDNPYELLVAEQESLFEHTSDKNCLNNTFEAYIPLWNEEKQLYGWISKGHVLNFQNWLSRHRRR